MTFPPTGPETSGALLVLAPHPDDEALGCSLLMQRFAAAGGRIVIAWLTDGGGSHGPLSGWSRRALVRRRQREARAGILALRVRPTASYRLDYRDGFLGDHREHATRRLRGICRRHGIGALVVTDGDDPHPDHRAAFAMALDLPVERLFSYPISRRYDGEFYAAADDVVRIPARGGGNKRRALLQHRSQMEAAAVSPMSIAVIDRFCAEPEMFIPVRKRAR